MVYRPREVAGKNAAAAVRGVLVGYGYVSGKKGYRVMLLPSRKLVTTVNVGFLEVTDRSKPIPANSHDMLDPHTASSQPSTESTLSPDSPSPPASPPLNAVPTQLHHDIPRRDEHHAPQDDTPSDDNVSGDADDQPDPPHNTYAVGDSVKGNWRGDWFPAHVVAVHEAGVGGSRSSPWI